MQTLQTLQTLRLPRGLWANLEETVIQQDRQFVSEVARSLGLPVQEVLRKCLGSGAPQAVPVSLAPAEHQCPWWVRSHEGCWRRCARQRISPTIACQQHIHARKNLLLCLDNDPYLSHLSPLQPVRFQDAIYWVGQDTHVYREDGSIVSDLSFRRIRGKYVAFH